MRLLVARMRRWRFRRTLKRETLPDTRPPHERYPEILHWREGDQFGESFSGGHLFELIALSDDGSAFVVQVNSQHKRALRIEQLLEYGNRSYRDRQIDEAVRSTTEYMGLIQQFNVAFAELQERDKTLSLSAQSEESE